MRKALLFFVILCFSFSLGGSFLKAQDEGASNDNLIEIKTLKDLMKNTVSSADSTKTEEDDDNEGKEEEEEVLEQEEKEEIQKEAPQVQEEEKEVPIKSFFPDKESPLYTAADFMLEKKQDYYVLWIKAKENQSVALLNASGKGLYYLRSSKLIEEQKENDVFYGTKRIGNKSKLYFLASSLVQNHPVLGSAFEIVLPQEMIFGYESAKNLQKINLIPEETRLRIRIFTGRYAQGKSQDYFYLIHPVPSHLKERDNLKIIQTQKLKDKKLLTLAYFNDTPVFKSISKKNQEQEEILFMAEKPAVSNFKTLYLSFNHQGPLFLMLFQMSVPLEEKGEVLLTQEEKVWQANY